MNVNLEHSHRPTEIAKRIQARNHSYLSDFVYGAIDGTVTTFAVVSGVAGAGLSAEIVVILGLANLAGDGFSMAASNFLGTRTDAQLLEKARQMERRHIALVPDGEREEIRQIFAKKGFKGVLLEDIVTVITSDEKHWIDTMLSDELGLRLSSPSPMKAAIATFIAFVVIGFVPLFSFVWQLMWSLPLDSAYRWSTGWTAVAFFGVGAAKSRFVDQRWYLAGIETLLVGGIAAGLAYVIGAGLRMLVSV